MAAGYPGIEVYRGRVRPEWIDVNDHMNVAFYVLAFDLGVDALWTRFGITNDTIASTRGSTFAVEAHLTYQAELHLDDEFVVTTEILAYDEKRIHQFQRMYRGSDGALVATAEWMNLFVDLAVRKVAAWPAEILARIAAIAGAQERSGAPAEIGRRLSVKKPLYTLYSEDEGASP
jgi:acyl-CoA thioester hydrolase